MILFVEKDWMLSEINVPGVTTEQEYPKMEVGKRTEKTSICTEPKPIEQSRF